MTPRHETQDAPAPAAAPDCEPVYRWTVDSRILCGCEGSGTATSHE